MFVKSLISWQACLVLAVVVCVSSETCHGQTSSRSSLRQTQFRKQRRDALLGLRHELSQLSQQCFDNGLKDLAQDVTVLSLDLTETSQSPSLPRMARLPIGANVPQAERIVMNRLQTLRVDKAKELYSLARSALRVAKMPSLAYELIHDVLRLDPDHKLARAVLGQQLFHDSRRKNDPAYAGEWVSPFEASRRTGTKPEVNHPVYGWIAASNVARFDEGLRPWKGRWISAAKEAELRRDFANGWEVRTEHFLVRTNTSLEEGVAVSRKLEVYYGWLYSNFAAFFDTPADLQKRFEQAQPGIRRRTNNRPMEVHFYASREEYNQRTRGKVPPTIVTNGLYWEPDRTCYLFRNPEDPGLSTAFHEATHQILDWATRDNRQVAARKLLRVTGGRSGKQWVLCRNSNFWLLEGIACYMESFQIDGDTGNVSIGSPDYIRFVGATHRLLQDDFYIDLRTFSGLGKDAFRKHPNHTQLYTQGSGFAHFLLHYDDGVYRDAFVQLLSEVYRPNLATITTEPSLEKLTGVPFDAMDLQYRQHMNTLANQQVAAAAQAQGP